MRNRLPTLLLLAAVGSLYVFTAGYGAILDDGDALYASVARQMVERNDWVTPYVNGVRFLDKPPLMYWLMALSFKVLGFTEFAARIPTVLAVVGTAVLLFLVGRKGSGPIAGTTAALAMSLAPGTFLFTRMVFPDMLFVFMLTLALYGFFLWYSDGGKGLARALIFYAACAGAVLSKGLIGLIFPCAIVLLLVLIDQKTSWLVRFHPVKGTFLFLLLALPWHLLAGLRIPGFYWYFFVNEHLLRFLGKRQPMDYESVSLPVFWTLVLVWLFPWAAFFQAGARMACKDDVSSPPVRSLALLCSSWIVIVFVFFSVSSRIEHYSLPIFPPLALMVGMALSTAPDIRSAQRWVDRGFVLLGLIGLVLLIAAGAAVWLAQTIEVPAGVPSPHTRAYSYYFAPLFELPAHVRVRLQLPLVCSLAAVSLGLLGAWLLNRLGLRRRAVVALAAAMAVFCVSASYSLHVCEEVLSSRQFAGALNRAWRVGDRLVVIGDYETANSLNFYTSATIEVCGGRAAVLEWGMGYRDAPWLILSKEQFEGCWAGRDRIFLLASEQALEGYNLRNRFPLQSSAGRTLFCNRVPGL